jgi:23S rRNA pseudouridine1911/1915/1917 synthase
MNEIFRTRDVRKTYLAIVGERTPKDEDTLTHYLKKNEKQNKTYVYDTEVRGSKKASIDISSCWEIERFFLLEVESIRQASPDQGSVSQDRLPDKGDLKYGYPRSNQTEASACLPEGLNLLSCKKGECDHHSSASGGDAGNCSGMWRYKK